MLAFGWCVGSLAVCVCCCSKNPETNQIYPGDCTPEDSEREYSSKGQRRHGGRYASTDDDICTQLYVIWFCTDSLPNLCMCTAECCDRACESLGNVCATTINSCSSCISKFCMMCESCGNHVCNGSGEETTSLYYCMLCGDCWAECGDGAAELCTGCNCDCGALDCAC